MFLVAEEENSRFSRFSAPLLSNFSRKWVESTRHIILLTLIQQQLVKYWKNNFCQSVQNPVEKEKKKKRNNFKVLCAKVRPQKERRLQSVMR